MSVIYQNASCVIIWLGPSSEEPDRAVALLKGMGEEGMKTGGAATSLSTGALSPDLLQSIYDLLNRRYWKRLCMLQDVSLDLTEPMVRCGYSWLP